MVRHGFPRYTGDLDVLGRNTPKNGRRVEVALAAFGLDSLGLKAADFGESYRVIEIGLAPNRIDLLTSIPGVTFRDAWADRIEAVVDGVPVNFISRRALIRNK